MPARVIPERRATAHVPAHEVGSATQAWRDRSASRAADTSQRERSEIEDPSPVSLRSATDLRCCCGASPDRAGSQQVSSGQLRGKNSPPGCDHQGIVDFCPPPPIRSDQMQRCSVPQLRGKPNRYGEGSPILPFPDDLGDGLHHLMRGKRILMKNRRSRRPRAFSTATPRLRRPVA